MGRISLVDPGGGTEGHESYDPCQRDNLSHRMEGRADMRFGLVPAKGSNLAMGLGTPLLETTLNLAAPRGPVALVLVSGLITAFSNLWMRFVEIPGSPKPEILPKPSNMTSPG